MGARSWKSTAFRLPRPLSPPPKALLIFPRSRPATAPPYNPYFSRYSWKPEPRKPPRFPDSLCEPPPTGRSTHRPVSGSGSESPVCKKTSSRPPPPLPLAWPAGTDTATWSPPHPLTCWWAVRSQGRSPPAAGCRQR